MNNTSSKVPPGFRFHPTDEELVNYYLRKKVCSEIFDPNVIKEVELYKIEPWDLQGICGRGKEDQNEWYFFSHKDKKYLTGTRANRATATGFWKATGRDKSIYFKNKLVGMRKTLVFYKGRAPNGQKSDWILHEYRLEAEESEASQEDTWVVCRVFKKRVVTIKEENELESSFQDDENIRLIPSIESQDNMDHHHHLSCSHEEQILHNLLPYDSHHLHIQQLEFHKIFNYSNVEVQELQVSNNQNMDQRKDWRALEKFVASQLSQDGLSNYPNCTNSQDSLEEQIPPYHEPPLPTGWIGMWKS